jgi:hypothetical protein
VAVTEELLLAAAEALAWPETEVEGEKLPEWVAEPHRVTVAESERTAVQLTEALRVTEAQPEPVPETEEEAVSLAEGDALRVRVLVAVGVRERTPEPEPL